MKYVIFFLILVIFSCSCKKQEEEEMDLDQMALLEEELDISHLAKDPVDSPQEVLIKEFETQ